MKRAEIRDWITTSFLPLKLSLPKDTIDQIIDNTISYWNTHSAYKIVRMVNTPSVDSSGCGEVQLLSEIKTVVRVYPSSMQEELFSNHPMWVLLGFITLDKYTQDLMLLSHTFEGYRIYLGNDFRWKWVRADDSSKGGWLFIQQVPMGASRLAIVATKRIVADEDIKDEFVYRWIRDHARCVVKLFEGNVLRKAQIIGIANDGDMMISEAKDEKKDLEENLRKESFWLSMAVKK